MIFTVTKDRFHDASGTGALSASTARVSYSANYYDAANRITLAAKFGTNGGTLDGTGSGDDLDNNDDGIADRPPVTELPARSNTVLVTSYGYDAGGRLESVTHPAHTTLKPRVDRTYYDTLGRAIKTIETYVNGTPSDADDRTTTYTGT